MATTNSPIYNSGTQPSLDAKYGPYASIEAANAALSVWGHNVPGLTVGILGANDTITEYWYQGNPPTLVPKQTGGGDMSNYYTKSQTDGAINNALEGLTGGASDTTDPHVEVEITQTDGLITDVVVTTDDIASAAELANAAFLGEESGSETVTGFDPMTDTIWKKEQILSETEKSTVKNNLGLDRDIIDVNNRIDAQEKAISQLDGHALVVVDVLPTEDDPAQEANPELIYRLVTTSGDDVSYEDYMYNEDDLTTPIKIATYGLPGIDQTPTKDSSNLIESGGVYNALFPIIGASDEQIDFTGLSTYQGIMITNDSFYSGADAVLYQHKYIPVQSGEKFVINNITTGITVYAFVKSVGITGQTVDMCSGEERVALYPDQSTDVITAPSDAVYLCVNTLYDGSNRKPSVTRKAVGGTIATLQDGINGCVKITETPYTKAQQEQILKNAGVEVPADLIDIFSSSGSSSVVERTLPISNILENYFIPTSGELTQYLRYNVQFYDITGVSSVKIVGSTSIADNPRAYAFYNGNTASATKVGDVGPTISTSYEYNLEVPSGATYLACTINTTTSNIVTVSPLSAGSSKMSALVQDVEALKERNNSTFGLYKVGNNYYCFNDKIIRLFKREGPNNLFCLSVIYTGSVSASGINFTSTIQTCGTDNVGPISIFNTSLFPNRYGEWAGGYHTVSVNGVACPTAEQQSLSVKVNGVLVSSDGLYYGKVHFKAVNNIYFPQSVTGSNLNFATKAIVETRDYTIDEKMNVKVMLNVVNPVRVSAYYGLQAVTIGFTTVTLPNNNKEFNMASISAPLYLSKPERKYYMVNSNGNMHYDLTLLDTGLGMFDKQATRFGFFNAGVRKAYFYLIDSNSSTYSSTIETGAVLGWEGIYDIYFD